MTARSGLTLTALLLAFLAYGMASGIGTGAPAGYAGADCFHLDADGVLRDCEDAAGRPRTPTAAVQAANWAWWGTAALPVALAAALFLLWRRRHDGSAEGSRSASGPDR